MMASLPLSASLSVLPIVPNSASTDTPTVCAESTTFRESAMFSSKGSIEPSIITDVKPVLIAVSISS